MPSPGDRFVDGRRPVKERPNFGPGQVRTLEEIKVRIRFREHFIGGRWIVRIIRKPYQKKGSWWVDVKILDDELLKAHAANHTMSLCDCNVVPYPDQKWNSTNWLERI